MPRGREEPGTLLSCLWEVLLLFMPLGLSMGVDSRKDLAFSPHLDILDWDA